MKQFAIAGRAVAAFALAGAIVAFASAASAEDAYEAFVTSKAMDWALTDGGYGSQGFHHGLPTTGNSGVFAATAHRTEPVAGAGEAMRDASIFAYTPESDYGSRGIEHWLPQYRQD